VWENNNSLSFAPISLSISHTFIHSQIFIVFNLSPFRPHSRIGCWLLLLYLQKKACATTFWPRQVFWAHPLARCTTVSVHEKMLHSHATCFINRLRSLSWLSKRNAGYQDEALFSSPSLSFYQKLKTPFMPEQAFEVLTIVLQKRGACASHVSRLSL
jgi:hypothetical protein